MQLGPVAAEHEIAHIDAAGAGSCSVDNLPINLRVPLFEMVEVLQKQEIPVGAASAEPVYACHTELWMLSWGS